MCVLELQTDGNHEEAACHLLTCHFIMEEFAATSPLQDLRWLDWGGRGAEEAKGTVETLIKMQYSLNVMKSTGCGCGVKELF